MNIMTVSVTERTREIGTRKALGATNTAILTQFIIESIVLCAIGGVIGVGLGIGLWFCAQPGHGLFGQTQRGGHHHCRGVQHGHRRVLWLLPRQKAAKMDPIDALRYE